MSKIQIMGNFFIFILDNYQSLDEFLEKCNKQGIFALCCPVCLAMFES